LNEKKFIFTVCGKAGRVLGAFGECSFVFMILSAPFGSQNPLEAEFTRRRGNAKTALRQRTDQFRLHGLPICASRSKTFKAIGASRGLPEGRFGRSSPCEKKIEKLKRCLRARHSIARKNKPAESGAA